MGVKTFINGAKISAFNDIELRQESKLLPLVDRDGNPAIPKELTRKESGLGWRYGKYRGINSRILCYVGAAGEPPVEVVESKLKEMTDPYLPATRKDFTNAAYSDPTLAPSLENRNNSLFENGFVLELELKSNLDPLSGKPMDPVQQKITLDNYTTVYGASLQKIRDWTEKKDIALLEKLKASHIGCIVQGRSLTLITPPLSVLGIGQLPFSLTTMSTEEVGAPIIDISRRKLVAIKLDTKSKKLALIDEMIYCIRKHWGLRTDSMFFGASAIEPVLQTSKSYKRLINFDGTKSIVAAYMTKLLLKYESLQGENINQETQLQEILDKLVSDGTDVIGIRGDAAITPVPVKVDTPMMQFWKDTYEGLLMSAGGSTSSQLGRTAGLNRDTATIQEIVHQKYIRTPDEEMLAAFYENQLLNPLLVHLSGGANDQEGNQSLELPVKICIRRITKVDESAQKAQPGVENTEINDNRTKEQKLQLDNNEIKQKDVENQSIGA